MKNSVLCKGLHSVLFDDFIYDGWHAARYSQQEQLVYATIENSLYVLVVSPFHAFE